MSKKLIALIVLIIVVCISCYLYITFNKTQNTIDPIANEPTTVSKNQADPERTSITLGEETIINSLKKYDLSGTSDSIIITDAVKWKVPDYGKGVTVSFSIAIPYTIIENGTEYLGTYFLGDSNYNEILPKGCSYNVKVTNLDKEGNITLIIDK